MTTLLKHGMGSLPFRFFHTRWAHFALPAPSQTAIQHTIDTPFCLPESDHGLEKNPEIQIPSFPFPGSMELMAVPKKKVSKHKRGIRNGPKALKPVPVIVRCKDAPTLATASIWDQTQSCGAPRNSRVARSSTEAELCSLASSVSELTWPLLLREIGILLPTPPRLWCDNQLTMALASNPIFHTRTKHIGIDLQFIWEKINRKELLHYYISRAGQPAIFSPSRYQGHD